MSPPPRVSILIPNFNNGRQSSQSGQRDFIDDLLGSLVTTLEDDPTPVEILIADDGSTDDSLATCREWAQRTWRGWRGGEPFCRLFERPHCGVLSRVANALTEAARGEFCCRLDGDIVVRTPRWAEKLVATFETGPPDVGVIGPKQLTPDGRVHSAGDWVLHPRGYHHVAQGADAADVRRTREVDHVMGCFYGHRRVVWTELGGYDETFLRGQTVDFGMRARLAGWRVLAVPHIEFIHAHVERKPRQNTADTQSGIARTLDRFAEKWGFDRLAPDLSVVAERYAGTPLLWNADVFGPVDRGSGPRVGQTPLDIRHSDWSRYAGDRRFRAAMDSRVEVVDKLASTLPPEGRVVQVGSGVGLLTHLLAIRGMTVVGIESDAGAADLARRAVAGQAYPGATPEFITPDATAPGERLPLGDGTTHAVLLIDMLHAHPNPVGLFREARRILAPGGVAVFIVPERVLNADPAEGYIEHELVLQLQQSRCFRPVRLSDAPKIPGNIVLYGERLDAEPPTHAGHLEHPRVDNAAIDDPMQPAQTRSVATSAP